MSPAPPPEVLSRLVRQNSEDLLRAFHLDRFPGAGKILSPLIRPSAKRFAVDIWGFETALAQGGLLSAARYALEHYASPPTILGAENIPKGPFLIASNHPGMTDAMVIWHSIDRPDLKTLAGRRDLLDLLPATLQTLLIIKEDDKASAFHAANSALRQGNPVLTFPAGRIEPDPAVRPGLRESLKTWSPSVALLARRAGVPILPVLVTGTLSGEAYRSPLVSWFRDPEDRAWAAATLQVLLRRYRFTSPTLHLFPAIHPTRDEDLAETMLRLTQPIADMA
ncbi:MAG: 1-acyl-sn-glycerol-3-phosphate acyltransferase [Fimbriimonadaceae bacterium]|nr:1-acyl-sn-glycerol-3-phosphate acyltransferase [Fimbriimonadaceae bacterium]